MAWPLILLAIPSVLIGFVGFPPEDGPLHHFLEPVFAAEEGVPAEEDALHFMQEAPAGEAAAEEGEVAHAEEEHHVSTATTITFGAISTGVAVAGILVAYLTYITGTISAVAIAQRFRGIYDFLFNKWYFDEIYDRLLVQPLRTLASFSWRVIDEGIIDATVNGVATGIGAVSQRLRHVQTGLVANYALAIALGMVVLVGIYLAGFSNLFR
jgi:NADH-quinone oxidoreductase subunit L